MFRLSVPAVEHLFLHSCPHAFALGVVMTSAAGAVHALNNAVFCDSCVVFRTCILTSAVGMDNRSSNLRMHFYCVWKRFDAQICLHVVVHRQPHCLWVKAVKDCRYIQLTVLGGHLRNIGYSLDEGLFGCEITPDFIVWFLCLTVSLGDSVWLVLLRNL